MTPAGPAQFPRITGINLNGRSIAVPHDLEGDPRIVVVAFEQAQQRDVDTWLTALSPDLAAAPTLKLYELPVIYTGSAAFRFWVNNGMRSGITDETARNRTVTVYTDREKFFAELGVKRESITTFVLGASGEIRWRADGPAAPETLSSLRRILAEPHGSSTPPDGSR